MTLVKAARRAPTNLSMAVNRTSFTLTGAANQDYVLLTATNLPPET